MKLGNFTHKVILITGATSGIGKALALQLAAKNVHLILAARRMNKLNEVQEACIQKGADCNILFLDLSLPNSISSFVSDVLNLTYKIDVLINNAGISQRSQAEATALEVDRKIMEINFFGQVSLTKSLWPLLLRSTHANIVLISSVVGSFGFPQRSAYAASKHALEGFFESWMLENNYAHIFFTTVAPGRIHTNISYAALKADGSTHQLLDKGQEKGIMPDLCAKKIIKGIIKNKRKIYVAKEEMILIILRKYIPLLFFKLVKKMKLS